MPKNEKDKELTDEELAEAAGGLKFNEATRPTEIAGGPLTPKEPGKVRELGDKQIGIR